MHMDYLLQDFGSLSALAKKPWFCSRRDHHAGARHRGHTTTFSAINALILRHAARGAAPGAGLLEQQNGPTQSYPSYKDFRDRTRTLSGLVGYRIAPVAWTQDGKQRARLGV